MKIHLAIVVVAFSTIVEGRRCPSYCTGDTKGCKGNGGKIVGYCVNGLACCDLTIKQTGSCGDVKTGLLTADFVSPKYPAVRNGDLLCTYGFVFMENAVAVKIEFLDIAMDGLGFAGHGGSCDSDMIFFKGFKSWTPPALCGNLTGYSTVVERNHGDHRLDKLDILALMSSQGYKFKIRLSQIIMEANKGKKPVLTGKLLNPVGADLQKYANNETHSRSGRSNNADARTYRLTQGQVAVDGNTLNGDDAADAFYTDGNMADLIEGDGDVDDLINPFIVRGTETDITQVPWQVSIRLRYIPPQNGTNSTETDEEEDDDDSDEENETSATAIITGNFTLSSNDTEELNMTFTTTPKPKTPERNCSKEDGHHFCGGTIISSRFILTAAHCFHGNTKLRGMETIPYLKVVVGDTDSCTRDLESNGSRIFPNLTQEDYDIETVVIHYGYDDVALLNDVALIKLTKPLSFNPSIRKIRMAGPTDNFEGQEALGSGWGLTNLTARGSRLPHVLQSSPHFLIRNRTECHKESERLFGAAEKKVTAHPKYADAFRSVICTSTTNATREKLRGEVLVGPGDSGGPLVIQAEGGEHILIGIVSYGIPPANPKAAGEFVDFFQNVGFYRNWINLAMTV